VTEQGTPEDAEPTPPAPTEPEAGVEEPAAAEAEAPQARAERTLIRNLAVLAVLFFLGTVAMGVVAASQHRKLTHTTGDRESAEQVASRMASALVNFDYTNLNSSKNRVLGLATGKFKNEYDQAFKGGLEVLLTQTKAKSSGVVKNVYLNAIEGGNTSAVVAIDQAVEGVSGTRRQFDAYVELTLVKVSGRWRVDGVSYLNPAQTTGTGAAVPGAATPTTAPPK
jgi:hypothetical protein